MPPASQPTPPAETENTAVEESEVSSSSNQSPANEMFTPASSQSTFENHNESASSNANDTDNKQHVVKLPLEESEMRPPRVPKRPDMSVVRLIQEADHSAGKLVNLLAKHFPCFADQGRFEGRKVRFLKRAQIFVADLWAAFNGTSHGEFYDIGHLTMFAGEPPSRETMSCVTVCSDTLSLDYRVPQMLYNLGVLSFAPPLESRIRRLQALEAGESWEVQLRGCSIWAVEAIRRQIVRDHPEAEAETHAVLLDFLMYDLAKEIESTGTCRTPGFFPPAAVRHVSGQSAVQKPTLRDGGAKG